MKLFRSHHPDINDGDKARDFIYMKDVVDVIIFLMEKRSTSGLYNLGTGKASTFLDLVTNIFKAMDKLINTGYDKEFTSLEKGVKEYVCNYLIHHSVD